MAEFAPQDSRLGRALVAYREERNRRIDEINVTAAATENIAPGSVVMAIPEVPLLDITYSALMLEHARSRFGEFTIANRGLVVYGLARRFERSAFFSMHIYDSEGKSTKVDLLPSRENMHDFPRYSEQNPSDYASLFMERYKQGQNKIAGYFITQAAHLSPAMHFDSSARGQIIGQETIGFTAEGLAAYEIEAKRSRVESRLAINYGIVQFNFLASAQRAGLEIRYRDETAGIEETMPDIYLPDQPLLL